MAYYTKLTVAAHPGLRATPLRADSRTHTKLEAVVMVTCRVHMDMRLVTLHALVL